MALIFLFCHALEGQSGNCPKIKVGVKIEEVYPEVFDHLNKTYDVEKHRAIWLEELGAILMNCLQENSPELEFIYLPGNPGADYDYLFTSLIALTGGGEDVIVVPEYSIITGDDDVFVVPPVYGSEYTEFKVWSSLIVNSHCFPNRRYVLGVEKGNSQDIYRAILSSVSSFGGRGLAYLLYERENQRPVPPREPNIETWIDEAYLSPLDTQTRKVKIYEKVLSCNWQPAFYLSYHSQPVRFPEKTDRGKIEPKENCKLEYSDGENQYILVNEQGNAVGEYTLQRGLEPKIEKITLSTCPLGNKPNIEKEVEIIIRGLELLVEPWRTVIHNGEKTTISVDLHETDPDGFKFPAADQEIEIKVTGLVDGSVSPTGRVTTDEMGVAWIDYKAGKEDRQIKITATFTPPGYSEKVTADATITIKPLEYDATLTIKGSYKKTEKSNSETKNSWGDNETNLELTDFREASFYVPLKMVDAYDVEVQNLRYEYYQPLDINLSHFNATFKSMEYRSSIASDQGSKTTVLKNKTATDRKISIKEVLLQNNIVMTLDLKTGKVLKIDLDGFPVEFTWNETIDIHKESWWQPPPQPGHETIDDRQSSSSDDSFQVGPVEEPVPDPTIKSSTEEIMKYLKEMGIALPAEAQAAGKEEVPGIEPDLLVKHGDGKTWFGGEGSKIIDNSEGSTVNREEFSFSWQATRKKKPL